MTPEQKEIRDAERKALAEVREWRRKAAGGWKTMPPIEFFREKAEELRAEGYKLVERVTTDE